MFEPTPDAPRALHEQEEEPHTVDAELSSLFCIVFLIVNSLMTTKVELVCGILLLV